MSRQQAARQSVLNFHGLFTKSTAYHLIRLAFKNSTEEGACPTEEEPDDYQGVAALQKLIFSDKSLRLFVYLYGWLMFPAGRFTRLDSRECSVLNLNSQRNFMAKLRGNCPAKF